MSIIWKVLRWCLFRLDAETAHRITVRLIRIGIKSGPVPLVLLSGSNPGRLGTRNSKMVWGKEFLNPVGLAAGFDKDAEIVEGLPSLGFGFAEIGTVTPRPQPGNEKPRLFRDPQTETIFNRMGFNGAGADVVSGRLSRVKHKLPPLFRVGVNIGKNKDTPLDDAWRDYVEAARFFSGLADYVVINVSSPNTPGLRSLQTISALKPIVLEVKDQIQKWPDQVPLLLKLAPEVSGSELVELVQAVEPLGVDGWVLTNTLGGVFEDLNGRLQGGWSGRVLTEVSSQSLKQVRAVSTKPVISVGGILTVEDAVQRLSSGADLVQVYSGWIFRGPTFPSDINRAGFFTAQDTKKPWAKGPQGFFEVK